MMSNKPKLYPLVSVLMPNHNCAAFLPEAIESILNQTHPNIEFIIVDDASTDESWQIIQRYQNRDNRIKAYRNTSNLGVSATRNTLFDLAHKESVYFAIMDSDDVAEKNRIETQLHFLEQKENSNVGVVGTGMFIIDEKSKKVGVREYSSTISQKSILIKSPVAHPSAMIRREVIETVGKYNTKLTVAEDFDLWCKVFTHFSIANLPQKLISYRIRNKQTKSGQLKATLLSTLRIQQMYFKAYWSLKLVLIMCSECVLLLLPKKTILFLFKRITYKKIKTT